MDPLTAVDTLDFIVHTGARDSVSRNFMSKNKPERLQQLKQNLLQRELNKIQK